MGSNFSYQSGDSVSENEIDKAKLEEQRAEIIAELQKSKIIVAEDAPVNMTVIQNQMRELELFERCEFAFDGKEALEKSTQIIKAAIEVCSPD